MEMRATHRQKPILCLGVLLAIAACCAVGASAQPGAAQPAKAAIEPAADELLHKMSEKLASAKQFTLAGKRTMDAAMAPGRPINLSITCELSLMRPNKIMARMTGDGTQRAFFYDGAHVTLFDKKTNVYATVDGAGTIDAMLDGLQEKYGFTPPLTDFLVQDPYADLTRNVQSGRVQGREAVDGTECHHLAFTQEQVDWDLWLGTDDLLPHKFVLVQKNLPGKPRLEAVIGKWDLAPKFEAETFAFNPPQGAEKIEMIPVGSRDKATAGPGKKAGKKSGQKKEKKS